MKKNSKVIAIILSVCLLASAGYFNLHFTPAKSSIGEEVVYNNGSAAASGGNNKLTMVANNGYLIDVDLKNIVNDRFDGVGGNIVPFSYMKSNRAWGYNEAYYSLDAQRLKSMGIDVVRMWIQVDWFEKEKGVYNFETDEMFSVCKYIEALQKANCQVQLTFSWKVGVEAQPWYSIPGLSNAEMSAPVDIEHFGEECVKLMTYLRKEKGYTNVKYLTFANEPNGWWDFECYGDQTAYYTSMVLEVDSALKKAGLRDEIEIWAAELSGFESISWFNYIGNNADSSVDSWSVHDYEILSGNLSPAIKVILDKFKKPIYFSEFAESSNDFVKTTSWNRGYAGHVIDGSQNGLTAILNWCALGVKSMSHNVKQTWEMGPDKYRNQMYWSNHFAATPSSTGVSYFGGMPNYSYYICSLMSKYIATDETGAKVAKTTVVESKDDVRASTFINNNDGSVTVLVECNKSDEDRNITIDFGSNTNKTFTKHVYTYGDYLYPTITENSECYTTTGDTKINQNSIIPVTDATFNCNGSFVDSDIPKDYCLIVYTTVPVEPQIAFKAYDDSRKTSIGYEVSAGESVDIEAYVLDGNGNDKIVFAMQSGSGTVSVSGKYTAASTAIKDEVVAVKAYLSSDPDNYKIILIKII